MITLYAITDNPTPPLPTDAEIQIVPRGDLAAICGPAVRSEMTAEALWEHERMVEALMDDRDLLPVRYGTCVADEAAAAQALDEHRADYAASLEAVRGAVELAVRVFPGAPAPSPPAGPTTGTGYLRARARSAADEADARAHVHEPLSLLARASTLATLPRAGELLRGAYLVDRGATASFSDRVGQIQQLHPQLRITCTGPWPPYSFTGP